MDCTRKFKNFFLSSFALQRVSDRLCLEHGLSIIEPRPYRERTKRTEYPKRVSNRDEIRAAIDAAMQKKPKDFEELLSFLVEAGCETNRANGHLFGSKVKRSFPGSVPWARATPLMI